MSDPKIPQSPEREAMIERLLREQSTMVASEVPETKVVNTISDRDENFIQGLRAIIRVAVRLLAVMMTFVVVWGVIDVAYVIYDRLTDDSGPVYLMEIADILATFGAFMAVLIAIEIFVNITIYLRDDIIHVKIVVATALMAIARKVIIMDIEKIETLEIFAIAAVVLALSVGYWLVHMAHGGDDSEGNGH
ncbi:MAG: hypothetical protein RLZZ303_2225 [Candidatus Hydrogenedentota bacterium]